jgi:hypothetical protein
VPPLPRLVLVAPLLCGCFVDGGPGDATDGAGSTAGTTQGQSTTSVSVSDPTTPTLTEVTGEPTGATDPGTTSTTGDPTTATCSDPILQAIDGMCNDQSGCGCASGHCFIIPTVGGLCGQCLGDADCNSGGCTLPSPSAMRGTRCNRGEPGAGCETDAVCTDPQAPRCGELYGVPSLLTVRTCGACTSGADCFVDKPYCSPTYDFLNLGGQFVCVAEKSLAVDQPCSLVVENNVPVGDTTCTTGICSQASYQGLFLVGVCGTCKADTDCMVDGQVCSPASVDVMTGVLTGAKCM